MNSVPTISMPWSADVNDARLDRDIASGMAAVEGLLRQCTDSDQPLLGESSRHLLAAGGKRFRPMLSLLSAQFAEPGAPEVVQGAAACELIHLATLYHDDVMDEAKLRRGVECAHERWSNTVAIFTGDFLFAAAARLIGRLGRVAIDIQTETTKRLVTGQLREMVGWSPGLSREQHYLKVISDKTGSLFAAAARLGAELAGASAEVLGQLGRYAEALGMAFQLSDDVLDIVGGAGLGKAVGGDLREGVPTLPTIYVMERASSSDARLRELLGADLNDEGLLAEALEILREHEALDYTRAKLRHYVDTAISALDGLADIPARAALSAVAGSMLTRGA